MVRLMKSSTFGLGLMVQLIRKLFQSYIKLEVIIDCGSALVTYRNEIESKGVQLTLIGAANLQSPVPSLPRRHSYGFVTRS